MDSQSSNNYNIVLFTALAYAISWIIWLPMILDSQDKFKYLHFVGGLGPLCSAFILTFAIQKYPGVKNLIRQMFRIRVKATWIIIGLAGPFILFLLSFFIDGFMKGSFVNLGDLFQNSKFAAIGILYWPLCYIFYGFGEQVGWRGYLLPALESKGLSSRFASIILGLIWTLWHLPLFWYSPGYQTMSGGMIIGWSISLLLSSVLLTWIFNGAARSILVIALFHGGIDVVMTTEAATETMVTMMSVILMSIGLLVTIFTGPSLLTSQKKLNSI